MINTIPQAVEYEFYAAQWAFGRNYGRQVSVDFEIRGFMPIDDFVVGLLCETLMLLGGILLPFVTAKQHRDV